MAAVLQYLSQTAFFQKIKPKYLSIDQYRSTWHKNDGECPPFSWERVSVQRVMLEKRLLTLQSWIPQPCGSQAPLVLSHHHQASPLSCNSCCSFPSVCGSSRSNTKPESMNWWLFPFLGWLKPTLSCTGLNTNISAFISRASQIPSWDSIPQPVMFRGRKHSGFPRPYQMSYSPDKYPLILLSRLLNFCLYFNLEAWGTAQSEDVIFGEFPASDALEEEFELQYNFKTKQNKNKAKNQTKPTKY